MSTRHIDFEHTTRVLANPPADAALGLVVTVAMTFSPDSGATSGVIVTPPAGFVLIAGDDGAPSHRTWTHLIVDAAEMRPYRFIASEAITGAVDLSTPL